MRIDDLMRVMKNYTDATNAKMMLTSIALQGGLTEKEGKAIYAAIASIGFLQGSFKSKINKLAKEGGAECGSTR